MKHTSPIPTEQLKALISHAKAGDKDSMNRLIELCEQMVYCNCRYLLKDEEEAKDMAQEVFLTVFTKLETLKKEEAFFDWVKIIKINKCKNQLKKGNPYFLLEDASGSDDEADPYSHFADRKDQNSPEASLDRKEVKELLTKCIEKLPDAQRLCIVLFYYDDLSLKQIARLMEVSIGTVKSRLAYGRLNLKKALEKEQRRGTTLFGRTPAVLLGYVAYFLKKQFEDHTDKAALKSISKRSLELISSAGAQELGDAALAQSAYAFVTADLSLKGLSASAGAFLASAAGKAVTISLVGGAVIGSVLSGVRLTGSARERQFYADNGRMEAQAIETTPGHEAAMDEPMPDREHTPPNEESARKDEDSSRNNENSSRNTDNSRLNTENVSQNPDNASRSPENSSQTPGNTTQSPDNSSQNNEESRQNNQGNAAAQNSETTGGNAAEAAQNVITGEGAATEQATTENLLDGQGETVYTQDSSGQGTAIQGEAANSSETGGGSAETANAAAAEIEELRARVEDRERNLEGAQANYNNAYAIYDEALSRAAGDLAECKAMVERELPVYKENYENMIAMNQQESGYYTEAEVAEALAQYNEWIGYYNIVYPATIDDVRNQIFPAYFYNLNNCGVDLVTAEKDLAFWQTTLENAKTDLENAKAALAAAQ